MCAGGASAREGFGRRRLRVLGLALSRCLNIKRYVTQIDAGLVRLAGRANQVVRQALGPFFGEVENLHGLTFAAGPGRPQNVEESGQLCERRFDSPTLRDVVVLGLPRLAGR